MLTGKLVRLRPLALDDLDRCVEWMNDQEVTRFITDGARYPFSRAEEEEWLTAAMRRTKPPEISLAIETLAESRHIGTIALHAVNPENRKAGLGIMIGDKASWNRGHGTDAVRTLLAFSFDEINLNRVHLEVHADNARAIACYRKCGFLEEGRLRDDRYREGAYLDTLVMSVLAPEYRALAAKTAAAP